MKKTIFMDKICNNQIYRIQRILGEINGVVGVCVSPEDLCASIEYIGNVRDDYLKDRLCNMGYNVVRIQSEQ